MLKPPTNIMPGPDRASRQHNLHDYLTAGISTTVKAEIRSYQGHASFP